MNNKNSSSIPENDLGLAKDLIYTRLDMPELPSIDTDKLISWIKSNQRSEIKEKRLQQVAEGEKPYPWRAVCAYTANAWDTEFATNFGPLIRYLENFPNKAWRHVAVLCQLENQGVFLHTDPDYGIGWRIYLNHGGPRLYFQKFKELHNNRPETWSSGGPQSIKNLCESNKIYVNDVGAYPWALTSIRAAHGVEPNNAGFGARITLLLFPDFTTLDLIKHEELLLRSAKKFKSTAIWY
jgi:hypothetical protein